MRLPWTKLHRAFPELDEFSDRQCEEWLARFWRTRSATMSASLIAPGIFGLVVGYGLFRLESLAFFPLAQRLGRDATLGSSVLQFLTVSAWVFLSAGPGLVGALLLRDLILRRLVRSQLRSVRCMRCDYSLLGLPVREGRVTCSECGEEMVLADRKLTPEDLIPKVAPLPEFELNLDESSGLARRSRRGSRSP